MNTYKVIVSNQQHEKFAPPQFIYLRQTTNSSVPAL